MTMVDCGDDLAAKHEDGWTINPIGAIYLHIAVSLDLSVARMSGAETPIIVRTPSRLNVSACVARGGDCSENAREFVP